MRLEFIAAATLSLLSLYTARAAEIRVLSAVALAEPLRELGPRFERTTGSKLTMEFGPPVPLEARVENGELFDLVILTPALVDQLTKQGKWPGALPAR
jgi:molybdate transport system substrate-binding protein